MTTCTVNLRLFAYFFFLKKRHIFAIELSISAIKTKVIWGQLVAEERVKSKWYEAARTSLR